MSVGEINAIIRIPCVGEERLRSTGEPKRNGREEPMYLPRSARSPSNTDTVYVLARYVRSKAASPPTGQLEKIAMADCLLREDPLNTHWISAK